MTFQDAAITAHPSAADHGGMTVEHLDQKQGSRDCDVLCHAFFSAKGYRHMTKVQLRIVDIDEGRFRATSRRGDIPDHFYVSIGAKQLLVACAVVDREDDALTIRFFNDLPTVFVDAVASLNDPFALLEEICPA